MTWNPYSPLPAGAVRDLLGITRALYRATLAEDPRDVLRLQALEDIGKALRSALRATSAHPGTLDHLQAWAVAEQATKALGELVGEAMPLAPLISATARRVKRNPSTMGSLGERRETDG